MTRSLGKGTPVPRKWTFDTVRQRCDEIGDCWIWRQSVTSNGYPSASIGGANGISVRAFVFANLMGKTLQPGEIVSARCEQKKCCSPLCLFANTRSACGLRSYASGGRLDPLERLRRQQAQVDAGRAKLNTIKAAELRALKGNVSSKDAARQFGVSVKTVQATWCGKTWAPAPVASSVFAWVAA